MDSILSYYTDDASSLVDKGPIATGKQAIGDSWRDLFSMGYAISWQPTKVEVAQSGDLGYSQGTYEQNLSDSQGNPVMSKGKYVVVWKKERGRRLEGGRRDRELGLTVLCGSGAAFTSSAAPLFWIRSPRPGFGETRRRETCLAGAVDLPNGWIMNRRAMARLLIPFALAVVSAAVLHADTRFRVCPGRPRAD